MTLTYAPDSRAKIAAHLKAFLEERGGVDARFDHHCGWPHGTTRQLLDCNADPTHTQLLEICIRLRVDPYGLLRTTWIDTCPSGPPLPTN